MLKWRAWAAVLGVALLANLAGCGGDDDPSATPPPGFAVELRVKDEAGNPVAGLELGLCPDLPWYQDGKQAGPAAGTRADLYLDGLDWAQPSPFFPATTIRFELEQPGWIRLDVLDIEGGQVRNLVALEYPAGSSAVMWDGRDDLQQSVPSGVYEARLTIWDVPGQEPRFQAGRPLLLAAFYADQALVGVTDQGGKLVLTDRRLFPYLYDLEPFPATDENGDQIGDIVLTPAMRFYLSDPQTSWAQRFDRDVTGPAVFEFTWIPPAGGPR